MKHQSEFDLSTKIIDQAVDQILKKVKIDHKHDIPYLAGYSTDGKIIFVDRHMPRYITVGKKTIDTFRYLILHETVEKSLIDEMNLHYVFAHQIALRAEQETVEADGINWNDYNKFYEVEVKKIEKKPAYNVPANLDSKPYKEFHDMKLLRQGNNK